MTDYTDNTTIRRNTAADAHELMRLAGRDSAYADPDAEYLVAERGGHIVVAVRLDGDQTIADPFTPTAALVALVREEVARLARPPETGVSAALAGAARRAEPALL